MPAPQIPSRQRIGEVKLRSSLTWEMRAAPPQSSYVLGEEEGEVGFVEDWKFPLGGDAIVGV
jgi:hypothetical protein